MLAGAAVAYKTRFQDAISLSSTEAEFVAASDAGKIGLYLRSVLQDLHVDQNLPTLLYEDNMGAFKMATAGQPTKNTRHIAIRHFALLDWVERDYLTLEYISTVFNAADMFTKANGRIAFHRHNDVILGKLPPQFSTRLTITPPIP